MKGQKYNCADLIMRCNMDEPFEGVVDDGKGSSACVNTEVFTQTYTIDSCVYYEKSIMLKIDKVTHTVRKGDNLSAIAKKLNVSVDDIACSNGIKDANFIKVGDVLNIDVDIRYGYQVSRVVDMASFSIPKNGNGYAPLSESVVYTVLDRVNSIVDSFGGSLVDNAGKSRVGNNFRLYVETPSGNVFQGNQHVETYGLKDLGGKLTRYTQPIKVGKTALPLALALEGVEIYDGWQQDGQTFGYNTQKQVVGATYGLAGAVMGAKLGAFIGAEIGGVLSIYIGGVGAVPGMIVGGFFGGLFGGFYFEKGGEYYYEKLNEKLSN